MRTSDVIKLSVSAILTGYLVFRHWQRERQRAPESDWTGHGIDVSSITSGVQRVRSDFASVLLTRPHDDCYRGGLLSSARRTVGRLAYFRRRAAQGEGNTAYETELHPA
jgi:hypothetical protein